MHPIGRTILFAFAAFFGIPKLLNQSVQPTEESTLSATSPKATIPPTVTSEPTPTDISSPTPSIPALGSPENPLVWMYYPPSGYDINDVSSAADEVANDFIETNPDLSIKVLPAPDMPTIIDALCDGEAHIGSLAPIQFMVASNRDCAEAKLIWSAYSGITFGGMVVTNTSTGITDLSQLEDSTLCIPNYSSTSGWLLPSLEIRSSVGDPESFFSKIIEIGDHFGVIENVYNGNCDAGTAFYDARDDLDLPGVMDSVTVISTTTVMPNNTISFGKNIDPELSQELIDYFLDASSESDHLKLMSGTANSPVAAKLIEINDYYYNEIRDLFERAGADPEDYIHLGY